MTSAEDFVRARVAELPRCLREVARVCPAGARPLGALVVTGVGASEGPARAFAALARRTWGTPASFAPLSAFVDGAPPGEELVVFSQGLSPNARLATARAVRYARSVLFTSVRGDAPADIRDALAGFGGSVIVLPPATENGTLLRVLGPSAATFAAALYSGAARGGDVEPLVAALNDAPLRARAASAHVGALELERRVAFLTAGEYGESCYGARNAWLEALCVPEPHAWDVLQVAHGPFQEFFEREILLVALEREGKERALFDRLEQLLVPARHALVRLRSALPAPIAPLDHLAQVYELVCAALRARPRDLGAWPGSGRDGPLYDLGRAVVSGTDR
jgi:creatinine amidohydrolase